MRRTIEKKKWCVSLFIVVMLAAMCILSGCGDSSEPTDASGGNEAVTEEQATEDNVSQEFKNALKTAQQYSDTMHMSKAGIYDQLTSEYGEGFPEDAAQYAVDNVKADWNENALKMAESYYKDMAMSKDAVYEQLISEYGEKFTEEQAQYAVDNLE